MATDTAPRPDEPEAVGTILPAVLAVLDRRRAFVRRKPQFVRQRHRPALVRRGGK